MMNARDRIAREFRFDMLGQVPGLRRYARSLARTEIDAEDLVHDALVHAYEKRASFRPGHDLRVWLCRSCTMSSSTEPGPVAPKLNASRE